MFRIGLIKCVLKHFINIYGYMESFAFLEASRRGNYSAVATYRIGRINFEDKKFRGYLLNLEIKYPCNFLYTRSRFFVQHVHVVGKWLALWKYFKRATEVKTSLPSPTGSLYQATFSCRAATIRRFSA